MVQYINKFNIVYKQKQGKSYMTISTDAIKSFDKIQHSCMMKALKKQGIERNYLTIIKTMYGKPTPNINLKEYVKSCPLILGVR
jgi:hypothetical protein